MGGLTTIASTAVQALGAANTVLGAVDSYKDKSYEYDNAKALKNLQLQQAKDSAALQKQQIDLDAKQAEAARADGLRRAIAKQRAAYGASGASYSDGSGQAVLLGLFDETEEERARRESLDQLKANILDQNVTQTQRLNTLQLAQLKERSSLKRATAATDVFSTIF